MSEPIFEWRYRGDVWRLEWCEHEGREFANLRRWYWQNESLKPSRQGATLSIERLAELHAALGDFLGQR